MPLVAHRTVRFAHAAGFGWLPLRHAGNNAVLVHHEGVVVLRAPRATKVRRLAIGEAFEIDGRAFRLERTDDVVIGARRLGAYVLFNVWFSSGKSESWRGFRIDAERRLVDVTVTPQSSAHATRSLAGVPLAALADRTADEGAVVDEGVAAAVVAPLLRDGCAMNEVIIDWNGEAVAIPSDRALAAPPEEIVRAFGALVGKRPPRRSSRSDVEAIRHVTPATAADVAAVVRALFADEWALEQAIREQAALLDVDELERARPA